LFDATSRGLAGSCPRYGGKAFRAGSSPREIPESQTSQLSYGHEFYSYGYRLSDHFPSGLAAEGKIQSSTTFMGQPVLQLLTSQIGKGMSGSPVWDVERQCVVGMVNAFWRTKHYIDSGLALAIHNLDKPEPNKF
jgi:hypothetical protein